MNLRLKKFSATKKSLGPHSTTTSENVIDIANLLALMLLEVFLTVLYPTPAAFSV